MAWMERTMLTAMMVRLQTQWVGWFYLLDLAMHLLRIPHGH